MSGHEQYGEDLALMCLGTLEGDARVELEKHLATCSSCRRELERLRGDMALMAMSAVGPRPPQRSRQRLLEAIAKEPRAATAGAGRGRGFQWWWTALGWAAAALMLLVVIQLSQANRGLREAVASLGSMVGQQRIELEDAKRVADTLTGKDVQTVTLVAAKTQQQPQGKAFYLRSKSGLVFVANNLPPLAPEKIYELWLIPNEGKPIAAGLFKPDAHGSATVVNPPLPAGVEPKAFVVTLEPESGSHDAPRGSAVMGGA